MEVTNVLAGVAVRDFDSALDWCERQLGRPADAIPMENEPVAEWRLAPTRWIQLIGDPDRAGTALLTLAVNDLERQLAVLAERHITPGPISTAPGIVRTTLISDPDGNTITIAEDLAGDG
ncbi:MAG: VOC family protein [Microbacterium sp.]|uniref:VOC family protein n=1 Tax=Microbacterium sp. TaxID=51671 RepID=UPI003D6FC698